MNWFGFDINVATTPKPWGPRETVVVKELIQTLVGNTIGATKRTSGHLHAILHNLNDETIESIKCYQDLGRDTIDIGKQKFGHSVGINCKADTYHAFTVNGCNSYINTPGFSMDVDVDGQPEYCRVGNHYYGYPLIVDQVSNVYTRAWHYNLEADAGSHWGNMMPYGFSDINAETRIVSMHLGTLVIIQFYVFGVSDQTHLYFTLPWDIKTHTADSHSVVGFLSGMDNGSQIGSVEAVWNDDDKILEIGTPGSESSFWTASGTKGVQGILTVLNADPTD